MESHANYTLVGTVVVIVLGFITGIVIWLSSTRDEEQLSYYQINFRQFSLSGLQKESPVTMRGIRIGKVDSLRIDSRDVGLVEVVVSVQADAPVKSDTEAVVERNLVTGMASIDLIKGSREAPLLAATTVDGDYPVIPEGKTALGSLQESLPQITERLGQLVTRLNAFFTPENQYAFSSMLHELKGFSEKLNAENNGIAVTMSEMNDMVRQLRDAATYLNQHSDELVNSFTSSADTVRAEAAMVGDAMSNVAKDLSSTLQRYQDPRTVLSGPPPSAYGPGESAK